MAEVLKKGKPWTKTVRCTGKGHFNNMVGCGARLRIGEADLYYLYSGEDNRFIIFSCPECGSETELPGNAKFEKMQILGKRLTVEQMYELRKKFAYSCRQEGQGR
jgi:rRNA maturation protein Nop10